MKITARRPLSAVFVLLVLTAAMALGLIILNIRQSQKESEKSNKLRSANAVRSIKSLEKEMERTYNSEIRKTESNVKLMVNVLRPYVKGNTFTGLRIYDDGVVVQTGNGEIRYPPDFPYYFEDFTVGDLESEWSLNYAVLQSKDGSEPIPVWITVKNIKNDFWYVDWVSESEYNEIMNRQREIFSMIEDMQKSFDGYLFLFETHDPEKKASYVPPEFSMIKSAADLGLTEEDFEANKPVVSIDYETYFASYSPLRLFGSQVTAVFLVKTDDKISIILSNTAIIMTLILVTVLAVILWAYWTRTYVRDHSLTEAQVMSYRPSNIRRMARSFGFIGMIVIFVISVFLESMGKLSLDSSNNNNLLDLMADKMSDNKGLISHYEKDAEDWAVFYANKLASLFITYPEILTKEFLADANELFESEYIIVFDENGHEIVSSNSLINLDLEKDLKMESGDLSILLKGAPKVILDPEEDHILGTTTQLIGVSAYSEEKKGYGALIIAIDPEKSWKTDEKKDYAAFLKMITPAGNISFVTDIETGKVAFSSDEAYIGKKAKETGLYENGVPDTELDVFNIANDYAPVSFYGAYQQDDSYQYYYMTISDIIGKNTLLNGLICAGGFLLIYWCVAFIMLRTYKTQAYNEAVTVSDEMKRNSIFDEEINIDWIKLQNDDDQDDLLQKWKDLAPERKTAVFVEVAFAVIIMIGISMLLKKSSSTTESALSFIIRGTWRRGLNILSFAGILIMVISFTVLIFFKNLLQSFISNFLDSKAKTIARLVFSLIQYAAIIALLYFAFDFLGFDTRALLASVSLLSLAVTLGAKDLVADILAGIFIIFEDDFHVGDIIDVNGFSGIVQEIGVRSTKLIGIGDNVKIIGNQSIKNVLNLSKMNSWFSIDLKISADQPVWEIETMLEKELPLIGAKIPEILSGPFYKGIMSISQGTTLYVIAECKQVNYRKVQRELNRAILLLFDKNGYKLM